MTITHLPLNQFHLWQAKGEKGVPVISMNLEITARCNNNCRHCYINLPAGDQRAVSEELRLEDIDRIAGEAVDLGVLWVLISGGEPLLRADFPEIYLSLKKKGLLVSVFTNATLVTDAHVRLFKTYPPRAMEVSVYGVTKETYERVTRQPGSFSAFRRGLNRLLESGRPVTLKTMAMRSNVTEMEKIADFCKARSREPFRFDPLLHLRYDRNPKRNEKIRAERLSPSEIVALEENDPARLSAVEKACNYSPASSKELEEEGGFLFRCGAGIGEFTIGADGRFRLCASLCDPDYRYDVKKNSLRAAFMDFVPKIRGMRSRRSEFLNTCYNCSLINICHWCPAHAFLETGEPDMPVDYFCAVAKMRANKTRENKK